MKCGGDHQKSVFVGIVAKGDAQPDVKGLFVALAGVNDVDVGRNHHALKRTHARDADGDGGWGVLFFFGEDFLEIKIADGVAVQESLLAARDVERLGKR